jgi:glycerol kinase
VEASPSYALEGSVFMGGAVVQWLRDGLGLVKRASEVEALAASVPDSGGVVLVPAFTGLGAPYWDPHARGTLLGLSRGSGAAHIARAALEAIAMQSADLVEAMARDGAAPLAELRVDGGAAANDLLMQMQADLLGVPVLRPRLLETTAFGAACLAALGCGLWRRPQEIATHWQLDRRFEPRWPAERRPKRRARCGRARSSARARGRRTERLAPLALMERAAHPHARARPARPPRRHARGRPRRGRWRRYRAGLRARRGGAWLIRCCWSRRATSPPAPARARPS